MIKFFDARFIVVQKSITGFTYFLAEEIRRSEGIQPLEVPVLWPNTRPMFEFTIGFSGFETSSVRLGIADEVDGPFFTGWHQYISQLNHLL